ncbi:nucleotidyltransferase family protein [Phreatobacter aquaticus]
MEPIDLTYRTMVSELAQRSLDDAFASDFSIVGRFVAVPVKGRRFWYFDEPQGGPVQKRRYVGPADDPEIASRVETFKHLKSDARARRKLVSTLVREAYLPQPDQMTGAIVQALADAGLFRLRGVLVGTTAFQCYSALLGLRLPEAAMQTGDTDFAQFHSISAAIDDSLPPMLEVLRTVDVTFREVPHQMDGRSTTAYVARSGFKVEFLTPNTGSDDHEGKPAAMPALGGASAVPLRFLDFLILEPVRAILLHRFGVPLLVPAPERYAVHKMIVAARRRAAGDATAKSHKDLRQAAILFEAMAEVRRHADLAIAWSEAWSRGTAWSDALRQSLMAYDARTRDLIRDTLASGFEALGEPFGPYASAFPTLASL